MWTDNIDLNEYAETNDLIVYYPQVKGKRWSTGLGCWNWSEYDIDPNFDTNMASSLALFTE
jgi:poly(3-hydroxybutyrate) depolymerase